jgi:dienelactone hydrolase
MADRIGAVFLSYASQDAAAAQRICEALRAAGVEVWFDQNELVGGDAWDAKIRGQIANCALFVPILSQTTQSRREAYFRLEWRLADERTHLMAEGTPFLLPLTIDGTTERGALVPKSFLAVQWTKAPGGEVPAAFVVRVQRLLQPAPEAARSEPRGENRAPRVPATGRPAGRMYAGLAAAALVLAAGAAFFLRKAERGSAAIAAGPASAAAVPLPARAVPAGDLIARIDQAIGKSDWEAAYALARQVPADSPDALRLEYLWPQFSWVASLPSDPPGAKVYRRPYHSADEAWELLGTTPLEKVHLPHGLSRLRFERAGYRTVERAVGGGVVAFRELRVGANSATGFFITPDLLKLDAQETLPDGMVRVPGWKEERDGQTAEVADFFLGKHEVTNREYQTFVDAGGYRRREFWIEPFEREGRTLPWEEAMKLFTDRSGRPGPSTWIGGTYPDGQEDFPVGGVSWFEAAACAVFLGRELPTAAHWRRAYAPAIFAWQLPASNLEREAPAKVGQFRGMSWIGAYDMAGNVREWTYNAQGDQRFILGASWSDPLYLAANSQSTQSPYDRSAANGFRLASIRDVAAVTELLRRPQPPRVPRDYRQERPVSDEVFAAYRHLFDYEARPLGATVDETVEFPHWTRFRVTVAAAYPGERLPIYLYLPKAGRPPYQTVLFWHGSGIRNVTSIEDSSMPLDFILRGGRAVALPVLRNTFDRREPPGTTLQLSGRDWTIRNVNDMRRTLDYLASRPDVDPEKFSYFGYSWGGANAPFLLVNEPRLRVAVLNSAGFSFDKPAPEIDQVPYARRVQTPVLMLNGQFDSVFPPETSSRPLFDLMGTPAEKKKLVVTPGGHFVPREPLVREALDWLDHYLGPPAR